MSDHRLSQEHATVEEENEAIRRFLEVEYAYWVHKRISKGLYKPIRAESIGTMPSTSGMYFGFFEEMFKKLLQLDLKLKKNSGIVAFSDLPNEKEDENDPLRITADAQEFELNGKHGDGVPLTNRGKGGGASSARESEFNTTRPHFAPKQPEPQIQVAQKPKKKAEFKPLTQDQLMDIQLEVSQDDFNKANLGLLDLNKVRSKNKSFFDEEFASQPQGVLLTATTGNKPATSERPKQRSKDQTKDTHESVS